MNPYEDAARLTKAVKLADLFDRYGITVEMAAVIADNVTGSDPLFRSSVDKACELVGIKPASKTTLQVVVRILNDRERLNAPASHDPEIDLVYQEFATPIARA